MGVSFSSLPRRDESGPPGGEPPVRRAPETPDAPPSAPVGAGGGVLDDVLREVIGEIAAEIQRIGRALEKAPAAPPPAPPAADQADPPAGRRLLEEALTADERRALEALLREPPPAPPAPVNPRDASAPPAGRAADTDLPPGQFPDEPSAFEAPVGETSIDRPAGAQEMPAPSEEGVAAPPSAASREPVSGGSESWMAEPPTTVRTALANETDESILEVEDLIKMHMQADAAKEPDTGSFGQPSAPVSARAMVGAPPPASRAAAPPRLSLLDRFDGWVVARGWGPYKRVAGIAAWAILGATAVAAAVTFWMRRV